MKYLAMFALVLISSGPSNASDKDILRDACGTLKAPKQKSACFDALDRIASTALPSPAPVTLVAPKPLAISIRGLDCEAIEYAELDAMKPDELESLYCSYRMGAQQSTESNDRLMESNQGSPAIKAALLQRYIAALERCSRGSSKTWDANARKNPTSKPDCSKMPALPKTKPRLTEPVASPTFQ